MKPAFIAPRRLLERKPAHGAPCTQCGLCCIATLCRAAVLVFGADHPAPCPALRFDAGERSCCDLVANPNTYRAGDPDTLRRAALHLIRAGDGCDARFNGEPRDANFDARVDGRENARATAQALHTWGSR
jgi:hypothetical protein